MGKISVYDKITIEKRKYGNQRILRKSPSKRSLLKRADARESADIIYLLILCDAYR